MKKILFVLGCLVVIAFGVFSIGSKNNVPTKLPASACCHNSYFSQADVFDAAYKNAKPYINQAPGIKGILVNHHLLAAAYIAEAFNQVATTAPVTVLLISPNHFSAGKNNIIVSAEQWQTPYGVLQPNTDLINKIKDANIGSIEEDPFNQEHGISGIIPFIKKSLPSAAIVPVIFNDRLNSSAAQKAADDIIKILPANTLVVGSFDFSHYLTSNAADFHDLKSLDDMESFNIADFYNLDIDSRPGLTFFTQILKNLGTQKFTLLEHSNSGELTHQDLLETTSYITGYFQSGEPNVALTHTLLSFGSLVPAIIPYKKPELTYLDRLFTGQDQTYLQNDFVTNVGQLKVQSVDCVKYSSKELYNLIDGGVDVLICRGAEKNSISWYKNKPIIYADKSLSVGVSQSANSNKIYFFPIHNNNEQLKLLTAAESGTVWAELSAKNGIINLK